MRTPPQCDLRMVGGMAHKDKMRPDPDEQITSWLAGPGAIVVVVILLLVVAGFIAALFGVI